MIFRDRDGKIIEEGQFFIDSGLNNLPVYDKICKVVKASSPRNHIFEVLYIGRGNRESIEYPEYTARNFVPYSVEEVKRDAQRLKDLSDRFAAAASEESPLAQKAGSR